MAKILITNNNLQSTTFNQLLKQLSFSQYSFTIHDYYIEGAKKRQFNDSNNNFYIDQQNNFIAVCGTMFYKGLMNKGSRINLLKDFVLEKIDSIRESISGNYLLAIFKNNVLIIFCEKNNLYNVFYYINDNCFAISNDIILLNKSLAETQTVNEYNVLEYCITSSLLDENTIFNNIFKLDGSKFLKISNNIIDVCSFKPKKVSIQNPIEECAKQMKKLSKSILDYSGSLTISQTGGFDSRVVLAAHLSNGIKPNLYYGVGDSPFTTTSNKDELIVNQLGNVFGLETNICSWHTPNKYWKNWKEYWDKYGLYSLIYAGSKNVFSSYSNIKSDFIDMGFFGEAAREIEWVEVNCPCTLSSFISEYYLPTNILKDQTFYKKLYNNVLVKFEKFCLNNNMNPNSLQKNDVYKLILHYRKVADGKQINFQNEFRYCFSLFSDEKIVEVMTNLTDSQRKKSRFEAGLIECLNRDALSVPISSHSGNYLFSSSESKIEEQKDCKKHLFVRIKDKIVSNYFTGLLIFVPFTFFSRKYTNKNTRELKRMYTFTKKILFRLKENRHSLIKIKNKDFHHYVFGSGIFFKLCHYQQLIEMLEYDGFFS